MKVHWTNTAAGHLLSIFEYIAPNSPFYAQKMIDKLTKRSEQIAMFPMSGRMVPEYGNQDIREVIELPYRIIYRIKSEQIDVLAVVHTARLLPPEL
ncbi:MAG: type II toxin-antitoxin system RelE/ParE family toxin [Candidatus Parabeggiatoa sp. nov. 1]|nr:MAG: type II toxin-antitoxin system RelE/ParE family toxin [Gammaproteobacteria bacterium]